MRALPLLLFILPFIIYAAYLWIAGARQEGRWLARPIAWLVAAGLALALAGIALVGIGEVELGPADGPSGFEDGRGVRSPPPPPAAPPGGPAGGG